MKKRRLNVAITTFSGFIIIFLVSLIPLFDLLHYGLPITHDGQDHVARIANFYQSLSEGNIVPRWAANLNWGYGHPILMFLYPLPSYISSFFHYFGFSLVDSIKIVFGLSFILSGFTMFLWARNQFSEEVGLASAILYMFAPYRFVDIYVRGAIGEHVAFVFLPLIFYFLLKLSKKISFYDLVLGAISFAGLLFSHNAITIMFLPFMILYASYLFSFTKSKGKFASYFVVLLVLGFCLASFFVIPAFFEGKYTLRDIVTKGEYQRTFITIDRLLYGQWNYGGNGLFTVQIGFLHILGVIIGIFCLPLLYKSNRRIFFLYILSLLYFFFIIFLMLRESNFIWEIFTILQKFQFTWRFLSVVVFVSSFLGSYFIILIPHKYRKLFISAFIVLIIVINNPYYHAKDFAEKSSSFYTSIYDGTTDTGESAPIWSVRFMEKRATAHMEVIEGNATIKELFRNTTKHVYQVISLSTTRIRENTLYFPNWSVYVNGKKTNIQFQDPLNRGLITFFVPKGESTVEIKFEDTKLRKFSNMISLFSVVAIFLIGCLKIKL